MHQCGRLIPLQLLRCAWFHSPLRLARRRNKAPVPRETSAADSALHSLRPTHGGTRDEELDRTHALLPKCLPAADGSCYRALLPQPIRARPLRRETLRRLDTVLGLDDEGS